MTNRYRFRPPAGGTPLSSISPGSNSQLGTTGPVVGAFIAGPIGALIGRVLAGTIEAVTSSKAATASQKKRRPTKKAGQAIDHPLKTAEPLSPLAQNAKTTSAKLRRKRREKKS